MKPFMNCSDTGVIYYSGLNIFLQLMGSTFHGCQCNQVCPKGLSFAFYYSFYTLTTVTLLFVTLNMVTMFADDLSIYKGVSTTAD